MSGLVLCVQGPEILLRETMASQGQETGNILRDKKRSQGPQSFSGARNVLNTPIVLSPKTELEWLRKNQAKEDGCNECGISQFVQYVWEKRSFSALHSLGRF